MPLASAIMANVASLLNDSAQINFTNTALLPYLQIAFQDLKDEMLDNNVPFTNEVSSILQITTSMFDIGGNTGPALPSDLIEIQGCYERLTGTDDDFTLMVRMDYLPPITELTDELIYWTWQEQIIQFLGALTIRDVRLNYIGTSVTISSPSTNVGVLNSESYLQYRCASLAAEYIGENPTRAAGLQNDAQAALDKFLNLSNKGRQSIATRRRPFLSRYKVIGGW